MGKKKHVYRVHPSSGRFTVLAYGPKGGRRFISSYKVETTAMQIAEILNIVEEEVD